MAYRERLVASWPWWVMVAVMVVSVWLAFHAAVGSLGAWLVAGGVAVVLCGALGSWGATRIHVGDDELRAGPARIELRFLGPAQALDREATRTVRGVRADARAWLLLRPWIATSVRVEVRDADDPTPYWLLSTRHPDRLAAALGARTPSTYAAAGGRGGTPDSREAAPSPSLDRDDGAEPVTNER